VKLDFTGDWKSDVLPAEVDAVIHLVQSEHFRDFPDRATDVFQVNTLSTLRMLDYARRAGARTFLLASSGGVYGYGDREFSEDVKVFSRGDLGFYLGTKLCSEILSDCYTSYMNVMILRFFFVYGPGQRKSMLIPRLVRSVIEEKPIILHGHDGIRINPVYVGDVVDAIINSLSLETSQKINVGGPEILSMRRIGEIIGRVLDKEPLFEMRTQAKPQSIIGDIKKMSRLLCRPKWHFEDGVGQYVRSLKP
jgi:nucleoside-diphosphate-sugar epimerase